MSINKDTFCVLAHRGLHIDNMMNVKPCCVFKNFKTPIKYSNEKTIIECLNDPQFIQLRNDLNNGIQHYGCADCFNGRSRYREDMNQLFETQSDILNEYTKFLNLNVSEVSYIDMRISNKCNFKCIMCCDTYSSAWSNDLKKIYQNYTAFNGKEFSSNWKSDFKEIIQTIKFIYFSGGEPFIMDETFELIDLIGDNAKDISIFINTNLSSLTYKDKFALDYFTKFKKVVFHISCDGFGELGEYIRYGFKTEKFSENLKKVLEYIYCDEKFNYVDYDITYAISIINVFDIKNFLDTLRNEFNIPDYKVNFQMVGTPYTLSTASLPQNEKGKIIEYVKSMEGSYSPETMNRLYNFANTVFNTTDKTFFDPNVNPSLIKKVDEIRNNSIDKFVDQKILNHLKIC